METPGLVVLADLYDPGWRAFRDGEPVPILSVNHAVRGVVVPAGHSTIEFRYWPAGFDWGFRLAGTGLCILLVWVGMLARARSLPEGAGHPSQSGLIGQKQPS
jgi:uncharacterized membrane protein YfhO